MYEEVEIPPYEEIVNGNEHGIRNETITSQAAGQTEIQPLRAEDRAAEWRVEWRAEWRAAQRRASEFAKSDECCKCVVVSVILLFVLIAWIIFYMNGVIIIPRFRG